MSPTPATEGFSSVRDARSHVDYYARLLTQIDGTLELLLVNEKDAYFCTGAGNEGRVGTSWGMAEPPWRMSTGAPGAITSISCLPNRSHQRCDNINRS